MPVVKVPSVKSIFKASPVVIPVPTILTKPSAALVIVPDDVTLNPVPVVSPLPVIVEITAVLAVLLVIAKLAALSASVSVIDASLNKTSPLVKVSESDPAVPVITTVPGKVVAVAVFPIVKAPSVALIVPPEVSSKIPTEPVEIMLHDGPVISLPVPEF